MDTWGEVGRIKRRLNIAGGEQDALLADILLSYYGQAMAECNRGDGQETPALLSIVRDAVCAAYARRGDEGAKSASVGGQSWTYEDIIYKMFRDLLRANQRLVRL